MASVFMAPLLSSSTKRGTKECRSTTCAGQSYGVKAMRIEKPLEELYHVGVERNVSQSRLAELGVSRWSIWKTGKCKLPWDWHVDQLVYIEEGEVRVVPEGSEKFMSFVAGDLVRYPKWFLPKRDTAFEHMAKTSNCTLFEMLFDDFPFRLLML